ncbi:LOW QUALITY PROTEIN: leukocyte elastase inhibitor A-like [Dermacentor silvarum]|uniref:LOW QUALITY PROTEIN: leukocyte elastase inhibitor A-like n=1 Tax=Dermacentor silvarum TaxID=543639 RepID=UPI0021010D2E|nr:LOW QUALITY PROTEIN: leukocyte elastase inhibitor A-like [Dermacentor silvarum]
MATNPLGDSLLHFAIDLYKQLTRESGSSGNIFYSPFSISAALSMALAGARNTTAKQLADVLHVNSEEVHKHFSSFISELTGFAPDVKLHVANRMYSEQTFPVLDSYLALLRDSYSATIESVDFKTNFETVRQQVNAWVEQATESKIKDLLPSGCLDSLTTLIVVNAIYFKGLWNSQFDPNSTYRSSFHLDKKNKKEVDMMYQENDYKMSRSDELGVTALEIPYRGGKTSMVVLLPDTVEGLSNLEESLSAEKISELLKGLWEHSDVKLYLPKFKLEQTVNLKQTLSAMGIEDFFAPVADLSGISAKGNLSASEVVHKAFVEVNEEGTEAAAATAVRVMLCCLQLEETKFVVDHPFMFLIRSHDPELVLFMGSVRQL